MKQTDTKKERQVSHTPGQWEIVEQAGSTFIYGEWHTGFNYKGAQIEGRHLIATIGHINKSETKANAELIASAPQLKAENEKLKADKAVLLDNLKRIIDRIEENNFQDVFPSAYDRAKAAIKQINQ